MRILVVTRSYPAAGNLYHYPFVHRRVLAYLKAGHIVDVFQPVAGNRLFSQEFEGISWSSGDAEALSRLVADRNSDVLAVHGFTEQMWDALEPLSRSLPVRAWLHGSEIPAFFRQKASCITDPEERSNALVSVRARCEFWASFLATRPPTFKLVFVSNSAVELAREDWGAALEDDSFSIIHNPIDTDLFSYHQKRAEDRLRVLMIRPFDSHTYGNDLAVAAIGHLSKRKGFERLRFTMFGDGPLHEETVAPLMHLDNVRVQRRFLTQGQIVEQHRSHGIFLVPTRLDTQGVSRDEAMSSGLVPVTNYVSAVPEFVDQDCAGLAGPEDHFGLADAIEQLVAEPQLFLSRSRHAAERVRRQSGHEKVIPAELKLLAEAAGD